MKNYFVFEVARNHDKIQLKICILTEIIGELIFTILLRVVWYKIEIRNKINILNKPFERHRNTKKIPYVNIVLICLYLTQKNIL